jgi:RNA polymerase sigma-70 factor (ECF subfamily)
MSLPSSTSLSDDPPRVFATTHWSIVLSAGRKESGESGKALASLCQAYWYPLYAYVRRRGYSAHEAQDLTQEFFLHLLQQESIQVADPERGKFRSFLLASLQNFLANEWRRGQAEKRGGGTPVISLDLHAGEDRYGLEPADTVTPEKIFERRWALTLLDMALTRLQEEFTTSGKKELFDALKEHLGSGASGTPYAVVAARLGMTEGAVKVASHRLRRRCREILRGAIGETVADPADIDGELQQLFAAISE